MKLRTDITVVTPDGSQKTVPVEREHQVLSIRIGEHDVLMLKADELCEFLIRSKPNKNLP